MTDRDKKLALYGAGQDGWAGRDSSLLPGRFQKGKLFAFAQKSYHTQIQYCFNKVHSNLHDITCK